MRGKVRQATVALVSGGMESSILVPLLARKGKVYPLYIRSGYIWEKAELGHLKRFLAATCHKNIRPLRVLDFPLKRFHPTHWGITGRGIPDAHSEDREVELPGRNLFLLSLAAAFAASCGIHRIALGTLKSNPFPDAAPAFFREMARILGKAFGISLRILTPFSRLNKCEVIKRHGKGLPVHLTFSCLNPRRGLPCGACNKCAERERAKILPLCKGERKRG